jgi:hypothetical protein
MDKPNRIFPKLLGLTAGVALFAGLALVSGAAESATIVNCDHGGKISQALQQGKTDLIIKGFCAENLTITVDDVTLEGHPSGGTISGAITIDGASGIVIEDLVVSGSAGDGIDIVDASSVEIRSTTVLVSDIEDVCGIFVGNASLLKLVGSSITGSYSNPEEQYGLCVGSGSVVRGEGNMITGNTHGVSLFQHGTYIGKGETIDGTSNPAAEAFSSSYMAFRKGARTTITGHVQFGRLSQGYLRDTQINGTLTLMKMSFSEVRDGTNCTGGVSIFDNSGFSESRNLSTGGNCSP